ncbi:S-adenosyl-L-methionine-dependent methyltransferase [Kockovaella imperatae]|uniref:S-adenosyl-L-methionine-dependent methyltransferase n=1 Tax=Kockovaella imperatae TaxID=4999 RepID=A0A1Y1U8A2_9TREE|nr:S-adenosyl-L-methionine-dependent methyltransferase [Kockovaella imperatae]ORX34243.1 S-adenosyl-L-methionine-dependent methyltransferase [Kockovaella imperatae]
MSHSIAYGQLRVLTADQGVYVFPSDEKRKELGLGPVQENEVAEIRVIRDTFWLRLVTLGDLGFAEAYMAGDCEVSDLVQVFKIFIRSRPALQAAKSNISGVSTIPSRIFSLVTSLTNSRFANTLSNSMSNIRAHYDLSNGMFSSFLSEDMTYSCAIFPELDADLREAGKSSMGELNGALGLTRITNGHPSTPQKKKSTSKVEDTEGDELYEAQIAKLRHIIKKADIRAGHRVLEIGSGWGSMAIETVRMTGCTVDTLTLSIEQKKLAEDRIKAAGLAGRIRVWLMDYRATPESWKGAFDRVVSIEMLEAVGKDFIAGYFGVIDSVLNQNGAACVQVITIPESRFDAYQQEVDFIRKWIFPGGFLPTVSFTVDAIHKGAHNNLVVDSISNIGPHYARTLREWRRRFLASFNDRIGPAMRAEHPEMTDADIEVFKRKWIYYFCYCEVGFSERVLGDHIITMVREGSSEYGCNVYD